MRTDGNRRWYLTMIAALYLVVCGASCVHIASQFFRGNGFVLEAQQLLPFCMAMAAGTYFFKAKVGHLALLALTTTTLLAIGTTDPGATVFHTVVLMVFTFPLVRSRKGKRGGIAGLPETLMTNR